MSDSYTLQLTRRELYLLRNAVNYRRTHEGGMRFWTKEADEWFDSFVDMVAHVAKGDPDASCREG